MSVAVSSSETVNQDSMISVRDSVADPEMASGLLKERRETDDHETSVAAAGRIGHGGLLCSDRPQG